jgi:hypothetical protein
MSNWEKFREKQESTPDLPHRKVGGMYQCQTCNEFVMEGVYFPTELTLVYTCTGGHKSYLENFKVLF